MAALVDVRTGTFSLPAGSDTSSPNQTFTVACPSGEKALTGGYNSSQAVQGADEGLSADGASWSVLIYNFDTNPATGNLYAVCLK